MAIRMQQRRGTSTQWTNANPVLGEGEIGWESNTNKFKIGDGVNEWADLPYFLDEDTLEGAVDDFIPLTQKGVANGVATLNASAKIPSEQLDIDELSQDAVNTALTAGTGITKTYNDNANTITVAVDTATIAPLSGPTFTGTVTLPSTTSIGDVSATELGYVNGVTSAIQTQLDGKAASSHTHAQADITNLTTDLAAKAPSASPTFTGTVTLPSDTSIGDVSATEIGYVNGVTSSIQTQLDGKAASSHTHAISDVTNLQTSLDAKLSLTGGTMTGALTLAGAPSNALDAATKAYVDAVSEGLHIHPSVVAATTANVDISTDLEPGDVVDGVTLAEGNRILVKNQTNAAQNGIYVVQASGAALRASDFNEPQEVDGGDFVFVTGGTLGDNTGWVQTTTNVVTIGTDPITFTQFSGAGTYQAGTGLTLTDNVFSVNQSVIAPLAGPTFTGTVTLPSTTSIGDVSATEIGYLNNVSSAIQTQLDGKAATSHTHAISDVTNLQTALDGKAASDHTHTLNDLSDVTISSAANNQVIKFNGTAWVNAAAGGGILASDTAPTDTTAYPLWYNTAEGRAYIYYDSFWVELSPGIVGPQGPTGATGPQGPQGIQGVAGTNGTNGTNGADGGFNSTQTITSLSSNYTLQAADKGKLFTNSAAITVTVQGLSVGEQVDFLQTNASQITFVAGSGITLNSKAAKLKTAAQYSPASLKCVAANSYVLVGDLG